MLLLRCAGGPIPTLRVLHMRGSIFVLKTRPVYMIWLGFLYIRTGRQTLLTCPCGALTENFRCFDHTDRWRCRPVYIVCGLGFSIRTGGASGLVYENQALPDRPLVAGASGRLCSLRLWTSPPRPSLPSVTPRIQPALRAQVACHWGPMHAARR